MSLSEWFLQDVVVGRRIEYMCPAALYDCLDQLQNRSNFKRNFLGLRRKLYIIVTYKGRDEYNYCLVQALPTYRPIDQLDNPGFTAIKGKLKQLDNGFTEVIIDAKRPVFHYVLIAIILAMPIAWVIITRIQEFLLFYLFFAVILAIGIVRDNQRKEKLVQIILETLPPL